MITPTVPSRHFRFRFPEEGVDNGSATLIGSGGRGAEPKSPIGGRQGRDAARAASRSGAGKRPGCSPRRERKGSDCRRLLVQNGLGSGWASWPSSARRHSRDGQVPGAPPACRLGPVRETAEKPRLPQLPPGVDRGRRGRACPKLASRTRCPLRASPHCPAHRLLGLLPQLPQFPSRRPGGSRPGCLAPSTGCFLSSGVHPVTLPSPT